MLQVIETACLVHPTNSREYWTCPHKNGFLKINDSSGAHCRFMLDKYFDPKILSHGFISIYDIRIIEYFNHKVYVIDYNNILYPWDLSYASSYRDK